jgi:phage/plasmid-like protein (TIGR03299 family)
MSHETSEWLNSYVLVGYTEQRGHAWHWREGSDNHYPGAIPVGEVLKRLFSFHAIPVEVGYTFSRNDDHAEYRIYPNRKAWIAADDGSPLGMSADGYVGHQYDEWLLGAVSNILSDTLQIGSAGLLRGRSVAWVSVETPENIQLREGVVIRPHLLATTSFDGSIATTYKPVVTNVVCDNTRDAALRESGPTFRVKHTRNSALKLEDAKQALGIVEQIADDFDAELAQLLDIKVTGQQWLRFLDAYVPVPDEKGRGQTLAQDKQASLTQLYQHDERCAPWQGTAFGVVQTVDTYTQHLQTVRNVARPERNMLSVLDGTLVKGDRQALKTLELVLA